MWGMHTFETLVAPVPQSNGGQRLLTQGTVSPSQDRVISVAVFLKRRGLPYQAGPCPSRPEPRQTSKYARPGRRSRADRNEPLRKAHGAKLIGVVAVVSQLTFCRELPDCF